MDERIGWLVGEEMRGRDGSSAFVFQESVVSAKFSAMEWDGWVDGIMAPAFFSRVAGQQACRAGRIRFATSVRIAGKTGRRDGMLRYGSSLRGVEDIPNGLFRRAGWTREEEEEEERRSVTTIIPCYLSETILSHFSPLLSCTCTCALRRD